MYFFLVGDECASLWNLIEPQSRVSKMDHQVRNISLKSTFSFMSICQFSSINLISFISFSSGMSCYSILRREGTVCVWWPWAQFEYECDSFWMHHLVSKCWIYPNFS